MSDYCDCENVPVCNNCLDILAERDLVLAEDQASFNYDEITFTDWESELLESQSIF